MFTSLTLNIKLKNSKINRKANLLMIFREEKVKFHFFNYI